MFYEHKIMLAFNEAFFGTRLQMGNIESMGPSQMKFENYFLTEKKQYCLFSSTYGMFLTKPLITKPITHSKLQTL